MIIFGTRTKTQDLDEGEFYCPMCAAPRHYVRKNVRPHFALYFIPLFPVGQGTEVVECQTCHRAFEPRVLEMHPPQPRADLAGMLNTVRKRLQDGVPVEYVVRDLTASGLDFEVARATVEAQLGDVARRSCAACGLSYASNVKACVECGSQLETVSQRNV